MDFRTKPYSYRPQRRHHQKLEPKKGRDEIRAFGQPGNADLFELRGRARQMKSPRKAIKPTFEVDEIKLRAARRKLFETEPDQDRNKGFKNALKMKMNGKIRELRDVLEPKPKKAHRELNPPALFLFDAKEDLRTKGLRLHRANPDSFLPDFEPRDPWAVNLPPLTRPQPTFKFPGEKVCLAGEPDWRLRLGATQDKMARVRQWREKIQPGDFRAQNKVVRAGERKKRKEVIQPRTPPMTLKLRPELAVTQDKMARVRQWREKVQPVAPDDFSVKLNMVRDAETERRKEVIQPRTPPMNFKLRPELAVTQDKMARVRQWRGQIQPEPPRAVRQRERPNIAAGINHLNQVDFRLRPELEVTQDKMVRVREWRENIQVETGGGGRARARGGHQIMPAPISTLQKYDVDWLDDNQQSLHLFNTWEKPEAPRKPREQRGKDDWRWEDYLEAGNGNVRQFDDDNNKTLDFMKNFI